jgi:hypothetical protein
MDRGFGLCQSLRTTLKDNTLSSIAVSMDAIGL